MKFSKIEIFPISNELNVISENPIVTCFFCQKTKRIEEKSIRTIKRVADKKETFCEFCSKNKFYDEEISKDILILSFKNIINCYIKEKHYRLEEMWKSEIEDLIDKHVFIGKSCPVLLYDEEAKNWFADFSRIGEEENKINIKEIYEIIANIINVFDIKEEFPQCNLSVFLKKYYDAIELFYERRFRPKNKKILCPTFYEEN